MRLIKPYCFSGKELYSDTGLNLYDFNARTYNLDICRFTTIDPMAEKYYSLSPYAYCNNNPAIFVDTDGKFIETARDFVKSIGAVHGNSAASTKAQHAYDMIDNGTGNVVKTGVSGGRIR